MGEKLEKMDAILCNKIVYFLSDKTGLMGVIYVFMLQ